MPDPPAAGAGPVDLGAGSGPGPVWGAAGADLNATLLVWPPGHAMPEHVNEDRDVLVVVVAGSVFGVQAIGN